MSAALPPNAEVEDLTSIPLSERKLSSLTDLEILELTQSIKSSEANSRPLVGDLEGINALREEYEGASNAFLGKIESLERQGWKGLRRLRGDGDCFYRAFAFSFVERLLNESPQKSIDTLTSLNNLLPLLYQANFAADIVEEFYSPLRTLLESLSPSSNPRLNSSSLLKAFNDPEISNSIVVFLRLLTSGYLKDNKNDFEPFMFSLEDDPRFFEGGVPTLEMFCSYHVEASSKEADHIQITALTRALAIHTKIAYLDQSGGGGFGDNGGAEVDFHQFEEGKVDGLIGALLYRPGHYDILYR